MTGTGLLVRLFGGYIVQFGPLGQMTFLTERGAWRVIEGRGINGIDPYRRMLPKDARPVFVPGRFARKEQLP